MAGAEGTTEETGAENRGAEATKNGIRNEDRDNGNVIPNRTAEGITWTRQKSSQGIATEGP
jgi:hypothetical protein